MTADGRGTPGPAASEAARQALRRIARNDLRLLWGRNERRHLPVPANTVLVSADGAPAVLGLLLHGWSSRTALLRDGRHQILDILVPGDVFGIETLTGGARRYVVSTLTDIVYRPIDRRTLARLLAASPRSALAFAGHLIGVQQHRDIQVVSLGRCAAPERLARFLLTINARLRQRGLARGDMFPLPMTQKQLADHLGLTPVHVNRTLRRLREAGVVALQERVVVVHDWPALRRLAMLGDEPGAAAPE